ncbi:MAG TPA: PVC-type heme-binding CxxCH protein [Prosthecobacter sp.]|nr:PVC-type heme-binding CxxCH protein [Prosthecobacter sp.]
MLFRTAALFVLTALPVLAEFPKPFNSEKGEPMSAEEAARTMELPPGFRCQVFAAEPDVQQPIAMAWDKKGRLWVAENYTYAENPLRWDTKLRDRIIILEDKDGDGKHDGRKVFWENGAYLTSVETGYGGVWILNEGTLSFLPDKDGDDVPDGAPQVLLDGFNVKTIGHNIVNGLRWGPDGWLYGRHGITDTSVVGAPGTPVEKRTRLNCSIWRYHPTLRKFEVVCHGGTNSWGHDWNKDGQLFYINTVIGHLWHAMPGGYYRRMFGTHLNPHVYEVIEQTADHFHWDTGAEKWSDIRKVGITGKTDEMGGGHAHVGMLIYQGGTWPKEYQGAVLTCNLHGNRINMDTLVRDGSGYTAKHAPDFMKSKDKWFRGIELVTGPDGNVFVSDWSDSGECHDNDGIHRTSGRIYKISYGESANKSPLDVAKMSDGELAKQLGSTNNWWARTAALTLAERGQENPWLNSLSLQSQDDQERAAALRYKTAVDANLATQLAKSDSSGLVRLELASALQRLPLDQRFPVALALASHAEDANDRQQPLMIWYGIEPAVAAFPQEALKLVASSKIGTVRRLVARRLTEEIEKQPAAVDGLVALALGLNNAVAQAKGKVPEQLTASIKEILQGMTAGLEGWSRAPKPKAWDALVAALDKNSDEDSKRLTQQLSIVFGSGRALEELLKIVKDAEGDAAARQQALGGIMRDPKPELRDLLLTLINDKVLGTAVRGGLAAYDDPRIPKALLGAWPSRSVEQQAASVNTLVSRPAYAHALLDAVKSGKVPATVITPFQARQIRSLNDEALTKKLTVVWGELRETPEAKKTELAKWSAVLAPEVVAGGDMAKGRLVFQSVCASCHKLYGEGGALGPDLTGGDRHKLTYLLENIIDPNAVVPADYRVSVFKLKDGRTLTGVLPEQNERTVTIQTPAERLVVERSQITEQTQLPMSLMPEGQLTALGEENARHLMKYLMSQGPDSK